MREVLAQSAFERALSSPIFLNAYIYFGYTNWIPFVLFGALLWLTYRLARNLHVFAPATFSMSPTYAMAWYIVPIGNFFMPARVVGAIARETYAAAGVTRTNPNVVGWWWAAWVIAALCSNGSAALTSVSGAFDPGAAFDGGAYDAALWLNVAAGIITIAASFATVHLFGAISRLQSILTKNSARPNV